MSDYQIKGDKNNKTSGFFCLTPITTSKFVKCNLDTNKDKNARI